ncbi:Probable transmembrane protein [plant metagenome]|uniref:Probable transmembrane protein n=1 Tax=plant metagenome TaxID=1297885 RepID=A0A484RCJ5_9ZZZZ
MSLSYLRSLTASERSPEANRHLAYYLTFVAGAANAGGFLAVQHYTSHMSGIVSAMADHLALGAVTLFMAGGLALASFIAGAAVCAMLVNWARRAGLHSEYALPLMLEAGLLLTFGLLGGNLDTFRQLFLPATVLLLCFIMGLQNAMVTKVSRSEIRTTHITGMVTDIGIELGKLFYWNVARGDEATLVRANRGKLRVLSALVVLFFVGGLAGAWGFKHAGFIATLPLAALLCVLAMVPVLDDLRARVAAR